MLVAASVGVGIAVKTTAVLVEVGVWGAVLVLVGVTVAVLVGKDGAIGEPLMMVFPT